MRCRRCPGVFRALRIGEREDLERPAVLARNTADIPYCSSSRVRASGRPKVAGPVRRRVEIADEKSGVVKCSEQRREPNAAAHCKTMRRGVRDRPRRRRGLRALETRRRGAVHADRDNRPTWRPDAVRGQTRGVADSLAFIALRAPVERHRGMQLALLVDERISAWPDSTRSTGRESRRASATGSPPSDRAGDDDAAVCALLDHAFERWGLGRVEIRAGVLNARSRRSRSGSGFEKRSAALAERIGTRVIDHAVYVMTARSEAQGTGARAAQARRLPGGAGRSANPDSRAPSAAGRIVG